jgi:alkylation response protein AidB-like acyl-CoA dehydrogenase
MHFTFTPDQRLFAESLRELLDAECTPIHVRSAWDDGSGHLPRLWNLLAEMGLFGLLVPEDAGGMGGDLVDAVLLCSELGRAGVPGPVVEQLVGVAPSLVHTEWGPGLATGSVIGTCAIDGSPYVAHAEVAELVLTRDGVLHGYSVEPHEAIDGGRRIGSVEGGSHTVTAFDTSRVFDAMSVATAAYLIGVAERMIDIAAEYARQREQFGKPIGAFQAVKHLLADALLEVEFAKAPTYRAAWSIAVGEPTVTRDVSMAKALANAAAYRASRATMQVHGGIGYTWEADLQLFMKKAWALQRAYGDSTWHRRRVSAAVL